MKMKSIFIYNPESGRGKVKKKKDFILSKLRQRFGEVECVETSHAGHATEIARDAVGNCDYLFVSGGDGTLNEVINGFAGAPNAPTIGYLPSGTVNDVARSLGLPQNIKKAVKIICEGTPFAHDIFRVNDRYGIYVCCAGLFTSSSYATGRGSKRRFGKIAYFFKGAKDIFTAKPVHVELVAGEEKINRNCAMMLILNSRSVAGFRLNKRAKLNDGAVEVVLFHSHENRVHFSEILRCMSAFIFGLDRLKKNKKVTYRLLSDFTLNAREGTIINMDGERSGEGSFNFSVIKEGVKIITRSPKGK